MNELLAKLREVRIGLLLGVLTLVYGFGLGMTFGIAEDGIKGSLKADAAAVLETAYGGDEAAAGKVTSKSWVYFKRAHLHANGLGTAAIALILLIGFVGRGDMLAKAASIMLGIGSLGYSMFWMFAGMRAPGLGGTGAAKETLTWLAWPTSAFCMVGLVLALVIVVMGLFANRD